MIHKVIIIGSGPAGYTAAIYCARAMLNPILITGYSTGGQLMTTTDVENFPGYPDGVSGPKLMENLHSQASRFGTSFISDDVKYIDCKSRPFSITLCNETVLLAHSVIIATGAKALWTELDGEQNIRSRGLSTCAVCDGAFFNNEHLIVIGGGDSAMEEANFLTKYASKVTIVHRREDFRASKIMLERARKNPKIEWITNAIVKKWLTNTEGNLNGAILSVNGTEEKTIDCGGSFIAIGHKPVTDFLNGQVELDENGYIVLKEHTMTSIPGIFACGDVADKRYKQAITASSSGCKAAIDCEKWLEEELEQ